MKCIILEDDRLVTLVDIQNPSLVHHYVVWFLPSDGMRHLNQLGKHQATKNWIHNLHKRMPCRGTREKQTFRRLYNMKSEHFRQAVSGISVLANKFCES